MVATSTQRSGNPRRRRVQTWAFAWLSVVCIPLLGSATAEECPLASNARASVQIVLGGEPCAASRHSFGDGLREAEDLSALTTNLDSNTNHSMIFKSVTYVLR